MSEQAKANEDVLVNQPPESVEAEPTTEPQEQVEAQTEPDAPQPQHKAAEGNWDKGLQSLQRRQAEHERSVATKMDQILEAIRAQGGVATQAQREQVDELAELQAIADAPDDKLDPYQAVRTLASELQKERAEKRQIAQRQEAQERMIAQQQGDRVRQEFVAANPTLADKYGEMVETARQRLTQGNYRSPEAWDAASPFVWRDVVAEYKATLNTQPESATPPAPLSNAPRKPAIGTRIATPGSPGRTISRSGKADEAEERQIIDSFFRTGS